LDLKQIENVCVEGHHVQDKDMPAELKWCNPWEDCRFSLQMKKGRLVRDGT
jgi:hypothetical protein